MTDLSLKDVLELLDVPAPAGEPRQLERFRKWVERLVATQGEEYVRQNRHKILAQWESYVKDSFKSCL